MEEKNCEILFEYLRDIIYDSENAKIDFEQLDEPFLKLGRGLQYLDKAVKEMKHYSAELSQGNLSIEAPGRDNFLCENLKNIHANLNHLTWQAKQVAKGDYSQSVSYLGEFSEAFNTMTKQLKEREEELEEEAYRDKLTGIGNRHLFHERAETMLATGKKIVFCYCDLDHLKYVNDHFGHQEGDRYLLYFVETVKANIRPGDLFVRLGGDEFCVVLLNCSQETMQEKFRNLHEAFSREGAGDYPKNFSYGIIGLPERHDIVSTDEILQRADEVMYEYKRKHKEKYLKQLEK